MKVNNMAKKKEYYIIWEEKGIRKSAYGLSGREYENYLEQLEHKFPIVESGLLKANWRELKK